MFAAIVSAALLVGSGVNVDLAEPAAAPTTGPVITGREVNIGGCGGLGDFSCHGVILFIQSRLSDTYNCIFCSYLVHQ